MLPHEAPALAMVVIAAIAAFTDWRTGEIPNWLTMPVIVLAPLVYFLLLGRPGLIGSLIGIGSCGLVPYVMFRQNAIGGGDVKLFAALGALGGLSLGIEAQLLGLTTGVVFAVFALARKRQLFDLLANTLRLASNPLLPKVKRRPVEPTAMHSLRLGLPILIGTVLAVMAQHGRLMQ
jgi:prepilin peptidase CpaA